MPRELKLCSALGEPAFMRELNKLTKEGYEPHSNLSMVVEDPKPSKAATSKEKPTRAAARVRYAMLVSK